MMPLKIREPPMAKIIGRHQHNFSTSAMITSQWNSKYFLYISTAEPRFTIQVLTSFAYLTEVILCVGAGSIWCMGFSIANSRSSIRSANILSDSKWSSILAMSICRCSEIGRRGRCISTWRWYTFSALLRLGPIWSSVIILIINFSTRFSISSSLISGSCPRDGSFLYKSRISRWQDWSQDDTLVEITL